MKLSSRVIGGMFAIAILPAVADKHPSLKTQQQQSLNTHEQQCFALAMIGFDNVINSRLGIPIQTALTAMTVNQTSPEVRDAYKLYLNDVVLNAYDWRGSPHEYAVKVLFHCGKKHGEKNAKLIANLFAGSM